MLFHRLCILILLMLATEAQAASGPFFARESLPDSIFLNVQLSWTARAFPGIAVAQSSKRKKKELAVENFVSLA
jgi:hypothetical protein